MSKLIIAAFLLLLASVPAHAKSDKDAYKAKKGVYPVSCDDLWAAVKDTLGNRSNYGLSSVNDIERKASFVVVGDMTVYTDRVSLIEKDSGCAMKLNIVEIGSDNPDWRQFNKRLERSLTKMQAAKTGGAAKPGEAAKPAVTP